MNETRRNYIMNDELFMKEAIRLSQLAVSHGNEPFGAVLVKDGEIIFSNENQIYTGSDPPSTQKPDCSGVFAQRRISRIYASIHSIPAVNPVSCAAAQWFGPNWDGWSMAPAILICAAYFMRKEPNAAKSSLSIPPGNRRLRPGS